MTTILITEKSIYVDTAIVYGDGFISNDYKDKLINNSFYIAATTGCTITVKSMLNYIDNNLNILSTISDGSLLDFPEHIKKLPRGTCIIYIKSQKKFFEINNEDCIFLKVQTPNYYGTGGIIAMAVHDVTKCPETAMMTAGKFDPNSSEQFIKINY